jgi:phosphate starvation-inducible protein PhoH
LLIIGAYDDTKRMVDALSQIIRLRDNEHAQAVSGKRDENLRLVEAAFDVRIVPRGLDLLISGSDEAVAKTRKALTTWPA